MQISNILVPIDFSSNANTALEEAVDFSSGLGNRYGRYG
jgi:nucleotide-binding universal stress UspA family protein